LYNADLERAQSRSAEGTIHTSITPKCFRRKSLFPAQGSLQNFYNTTNVPPRPRSPSTYSFHICINGLGTRLLGRLDKNRVSAFSSISVNSLKWIINPVILYADKEAMVMEKLDIPLKVYFKYKKKKKINKACRFPQKYKPIIILENEYRLVKIACCHQSKYASFNPVLNVILIVIRIRSTLLILLLNCVMSIFRLKSSFRNSCNGIKNQFKSI
jgi:hypothetical protein